MKYTELGQGKISVEFSKTERAIISELVAFAHNDSDCEVVVAVSLDNIELNEGDVIEKGNEFIKMMRHGHI
jgi:hypothetical protein